MTMKNIKKALISLTTAAVSAASFCVVTSTSAEVSGKYNTYGYYFEVPANTYIKTCNANLSYNSNNYEFATSRNGSLGGTFLTKNVTISNTSKKLYVEYNNSSPSANKGELGFVALKTNLSFAPSFSVTLVENDRNNTLVTSTVNVERVLIGDANQDGHITVADATAIFQSISNADEYGLSEKGKLAADVNFDGMVTGEDVNLIQQLDAGMINGFCD